MKNLKKIDSLSTSDEGATLESIHDRVRKREMIQESRKIAWKVLSKLKELGWGQNLLALKMNVSPQYVSKIVKGNENLTIETLKKLQEILDIPLLASYYEEKIKRDLTKVVSFVPNSISYTAEPTTSTSLQESQRETITLTLPEISSNSQAQFNLENSWMLQVVNL